jgi:hypothetical protein
MPVLRFAMATSPCRNYFLGFSRIFISVDTFPLFSFFKYLALSQHDVIFAFLVFLYIFYFAQSSAFS